MLLKDLAEVRCKAPGTNEITDYCMPASTKKNLEALISGIKVTMGASCTTSMYNCIPEDVLELGETNCGTIKGNLDIGPSLNTTVLDLLAKVKMVKGRVIIDGVNDLNFFPELETVDHGSANEPAISIKNIKQAKEIKIFPKLAKVVSGAAKKMVFEGNNFTCTQNDIARMKQWSGGACGASASLAASPATGTTESSSEKKEGGSNTVIVVVCCVIGGVLILVGVVIALFIVMKKKKKKAAEAKKAKEAKGGAKKSNMSTVEGGEKSKTGAAKGETPTPDAKGDKAKEPASGAKEPTSGAKDPASGAKDPAEGAKEPEGKDLPSASADPKSVGNGVEASN